jgi:DNA-binding response OmpR family regulator
MGKGRILVVDDEPEIVESLTMRLESNGYDVITAMDGIQATQVALENMPELIILDIGMPSRSGHDVLRSLRETEKTCVIPVIYLTARTSAEDYKRAIEGGADRYITKPFHPEELLHAVEMLVRYPRPSPAPHPQR